VHFHGFEKLRGDLQFFQDEAVIQKYERFVGSFKRRMISASVVAQLQNRIRNNDETSA
jgi:hypothetical protein